MKSERLAGRIDFEPTEAMSYDDYRHLCDDMQPDIYRKTGLATSEDYEIAKRDERTIFFETDGERIPLFVPLASAGGYNIEVSQRMTETENVYAMVLPARFASSEEVDLSPYLSLLESDAAIIVQSATDETDERKAEIAHKIAGGETAIHDFVDPRLPEEYQKAKVSIYSAELVALDDTGEMLPVSGKSFKELFEEDQAETGDMNTVLMTAAEIRADEELFDKLWALHDEKFDWLGEYHPVSMQENKSFFKTIICDDDTLSLIRFDINEDGERVPVCHGCATTSLHQIEWLTDRFSGATSERMNDQTFIQFFYEIVSKSSVEKAFGYAQDLMRLNSRLAKRRGGKGELLFESTNMSSTYIPSMVEKYVGQEPNGMQISRPVERISQVDYWFFRPGVSESV